MLATGTLSGAMVYRGRQALRTRPAKPLDGLLPDELGEWTRSSADAVLIPQAEQAGDGSYDDLATRYYTSASALPVALLVAYGSAQTGGTQLHRPEICYPAAGFQLRGGRDVAIAVQPGLVVPGRTLAATTHDRTERILYWSRVGHTFPNSNGSQRMAVLRQSLTGAVPDGCLVRMSILVGEQDPGGLGVLAIFARTLVSASSPGLRQLLVGTA